MRFIKKENPYCFIKKLPFDPHGWFSNEKPLRALLRQHKVKNVIEVGSWLGLSTRFFASQVPRQGKVYAIDTWLGSVEHVGSQKLPCLFHQFLSNVIHARLTDKIIPIRMASLEAAAAVDIAADLIYIDASHEDNDVYNDILHWHPHVKNGGVLCGDDWSWESVKKGVFAAAFDLRQQIHCENNFWWFEPL